MNGLHHHRRSPSGKAEDSQQMDSLSLRRFGIRVLDYAARMICVASLCWFALIVSRSFAGGSESVERLLPMFSFDVSPGYWTFHDCELAFESRQCSLSELENVFSDVLSASNKVQQRDIDATQLVQLAKSNGARNSTCGVSDSWQFDGDDLRFRMMTTKDSIPNLQAVAFAARQGDQWELFTLAPVTRDDSKLLPMGSDAKITCSRFNHSGELVMQIIGTSESSASIRSRWRRNGWKAEPTPWASPDRICLICEKDEQFVYVWENGGDDTRTILLSAMNHTRRITR